MWGKFRQSGTKIYNLLTNEIFTISLISPRHFNLLEAL